MTFLLLTGCANNPVTETMSEEPPKPVKVMTAKAKTHKEIEFIFISKHKRYVIEARKLQVNDTVTIVE